MGKEHKNASVIPCQSGFACLSSEIRHLRQFVAFWCEGYAYTGGPKVRNSPIWYVLGQATSQRLPQATGQEQLLRGELSWAASSNGTLLYSKLC